jgi:hypothetical protein
VQSGVYFRGYLGANIDERAYNEVHVVVWFEVCSMQRDE